MGNFTDDSSKSWKDLTGKSPSGEQSFNFSSFSGADIQCFFFGNIADNKILEIQKNQSLSQEEKQRLITKITNDLKIEPFAELQTLSVSIASSFGPVRRLGEKEAVEYKGGARTIAGSMIFAVMNRDVFHKFLRNKIVATSSDRFTSPDYVDQIPPFNILIRGCNEMGTSASGMLIDVKLTNFGTTFSIDDLYLESTYSYVARQYVPFIEDVDQYVRDNFVKINYPTKASSLLKDNQGIKNGKGQIEYLNSFEYEFYHGLPTRVKDSILQSGFSIIESIKKLWSSK